MSTLRDALARTLPAQAYLRPRGEDPASSRIPPVDESTPTSDRSGISDRLQQLGYPFPHRARIDVGRQLGVGATARVFAAHDQDLERPIAVKMLVADGRPSAEAVSGFIEEARITASLQHPNVLPVHEVEVNASGQMFFTMKRVDGRSLGSVLAISTAESRQPPLDDINTMVNIFIGVGQALAYAHQRRIIHQDVKPDNIMLGEFGEVLLVDWGSAKRLDHPGAEVYGTPLYMSPEQARGEGADERSDIYCLGSSLFHALTLRLSTWSEDGDEFWARKRAGVVDVPTAKERAVMPPALLAIAMKSLAASPDDRYQRATDLVEDLRRYQAGLAVTALRESLPQRARRWHRRNARTFWAWTAAALVVLALAGALYGERLTDLARWGAPRAELFAAASWPMRWDVVSGGFHTESGRVVSEGDYNVLTLREPIQGAAAIEYDGEILAGHAAGDVSLMWSRGIDDKGQGLGHLVDGFVIQFGAWDGAFSGIALGIEPRETVAQCDFRPTVARPFHARVEIEDNRIRMLIDGREICGWTDPFPVEGGYLSLFAIGPGKAYGNLRIYQREVPARVSAVAIGDEAARGKAYDIAAAAYQRIVASHPDDALGREALYKQGLCRWRQGHPDEALALWQPVVSGPYAERVRLHRLERAFDEGHHEEIFARLPELYRSADAADRSQIALQWGRWIDRLRRDGRMELVARFLDLHDAIMPGQSIADHSAAESLFRLGRGDELMRRYPWERYLCASVLNERGEYDRVIREYPDQQWPRVLAGFSGALWDGMGPEVADGLGNEAMWMRGRGEEMLKKTQVSILIRAHALNALGRYEESLAVQREDPKWLEKEPSGAGATIYSLISLGRSAEAAAMSEEGRQSVAIASGQVAALAEDPSPYTRNWARTILAIQARAAGDREHWRSLLPERLKPIKSDVSVVLDQWLFCPLITGIDTGDFTDFDACCAELSRNCRFQHRQRPSLIARFIRGECDEDGLRHEPCELYGEVDLAMGRALRAERKQDRDAALAAWRDFAAHPSGQRNPQFDGGRDAFVAWRIAELAKK